jgi:hypothetical protein
VLVGNGFDFVDAIATVGVIAGGISRLHAARTDAARTNKDIFRKSRREKSLFI